MTTPTSEIVPNVALTDAQITQSLGYTAEAIEAKREEYAALKHGTPEEDLAVQAAVTTCRYHGPVTGEAGSG